MLLNDTNPRKNKLLPVCHGTTAPLVNTKRMQSCSIQFKYFPFSYLTNEAYEFAGNTSCLRFASIWKSRSPLDLLPLVSVLVSTSSVTSSDCVAEGRTCSHHGTLEATCYDWVGITNASSRVRSCRFSPTHGADMRALTIYSVSFTLRALSINIGPTQRLRFSFAGFKYRHPHQHRSSCSSL